MPIRVLEGFRSRSLEMSASNHRVVSDLRDACVSSCHVSQHEALIRSIQREWPVAQDAVSCRPKAKKNHGGGEKHAICDGYKDSEHHTADPGLAVAIRASSSLEQEPHRNSASALGLDLERRAAADRQFQLLTSQSFMPRMRTARR
jgi:hypothetical protein